MGRVVRVPAHDGPAVCSNFIQLLRPDPSLADASFLFWQLWVWHSSGRTIPLQTSSTNIRNLKSREYLQEEVVMPPLDEQRILASIEAEFSRLDALETSLLSTLRKTGMDIDIDTARIQKRGGLRLALLRDAFAGELDR